MKRETPATHLASVAPPDEHDSCAIVASIRRSGESTHGNLKRTLEALSKMGHRSGDVQGEGDGCGVLIDIPRKTWAAALDRAGRPAWLADDRRFFVGHLMIPKPERAAVATWKAKVLHLLADAGADLLLEQDGITRPDALGHQARAQEPLFWQIAGAMSHCPLDRVERELFSLLLAIERHTPIHVASLSSHSVVFKVRGSVETLYHYYPELRSRDTTSAITIGHARYSTNTSTAFERVQPFTLLGHNGEINTVARLREQAALIGVQLAAGASDSQDLNRVIEFLIHRLGLSLLEAMEVAFPPVVNAIEALQPPLRDIYRYLLWAFGPYAQGPAAIIARHGDQCVFSVDALGLRPLWVGETEKEVFCSSEKGVVPLDLLNSDPKPLAPGEKMLVQLHRGQGVAVLDYGSMQQHLRELVARGVRALDELCPGRLAPAAVPYVADIHSVPPEPVAAPSEGLLGAFGWSQDDRLWATALGETGQEPLASLGYDGPLAALSDAVHNVSDYFKETVAVVTNPAVDREREQELFSTQVLVGPRPPLEMINDGRVTPSGAGCVALDSPILLGGHTGAPVLPLVVYRAVADRAGTMLLEDLLARFDAAHVANLPLATEAGELVQDAVNRLAAQAVGWAQAGVAVLVLDDAPAFRGGRGWLDPYLAVAAVDTALREAWTTSDAPRNCRRCTGLVVRSGAVRNLHDVILLLGLGADAVAPYLLLEVAASSPGAPDTDTVGKRVENAVRALRIGLEKVTSTMGIHALRGYGRVFASIGLSAGLAQVMGMPNYAGSDSGGLSWADLDRDVEVRRRVAAARPPLSLLPRLYPRLGRWLRDLASGRVDASQAFAALREAERQLPVALRHTLRLRGDQSRETEPLRAPACVNSIRPEEVDTTITGHSLPFVIASMSFGSQSEAAYRAYAEAAARLNIIAINGEGGEIEDLLGKYPHNRGYQIASGRFGVDIRLVNAANLLEIKIGQGAKPGEGGHLPGSKVSAPVARVRRVCAGTDLISPSNHHDIYSIEDLAQFIEELKTANPKARVAIKVPVVPGIGVISVGMAKAGADIINLSGYDGGTGAARAHSIRHVGLPAEIGLVEVHRALLESDYRQRVELWCDGGARTPDDVIKLMCLGANRVGFGTLAMVALGCTMCRCCHTGQCRAGITTQFHLFQQAGSRSRSIPPTLDLEASVQRLVVLFEAFGDELRAQAAALGFARLQDMVGRSDLLEQASHVARLDLGAILAPARKLIPSTVRPVGLTPLRRPRNHLTTVVSNLVMESLVAGHPNVVFEDDNVTPVDRALGTHLAGAVTRYRYEWGWPPGHCGVGGQMETWRPPLGGVCPPSPEAHLENVHLRFYASSVPGNGLGAFAAEGIAITVEGGAQDGVAKGLRGGKVVILKGYNHDGVRIDGAVGKGLAYGATGGLVVVQGNADSRACVRLSGADVIIGGEVTQPLDDASGCLGARANVKGFLCEYMTAGRVLVLGDPGPWMCAGMTGGVLYLMLQPSMNLDEAALRRRLARGAEVELLPAGDPQDRRSLEDLLRAYATELACNQQGAEAQRILSLLDGWRERFVKVVPRRSNGAQNLTRQF
jgi:glutamate synthase (NADPH/NADH) large chain